MKLTYEELEAVIKATDENGKEYFIPKDEGNSDYQAYLDRDKPKAALSTPIVVEHLTEIVPGDE